MDGARDRRGRLWARLVVTACVVLAAAPAVAEVPDLEAVVAALESAEPDVERAVDATGLSLDLVHGRLSLASGVLVPVVSTGDGTIREWVFVGSGRLTAEPPDRVEADQVAYFTGARSVDTAVRAAVLIPGRAWSGEAPDFRATVAVDDPSREVATGMYRVWRDDMERRGFGAGHALLAAAAGDAAGAAYTGAWIETADLGHVYWVVDRTRIEPVGFGEARVFTDRDFQTRRQRKNDEGWERTRRKRGPGPDDPDAGVEPVCGERDEADEEPYDPGDGYPWVTPWLQAALPGTDPDAPSPELEPEHYAIEMSLAGERLQAEGTLRVRLRAGSDGRRIVPLSLTYGMDVCSIEDDAGRALPFVEDGYAVLAVLPEPTRAGATLELTLRFAGEPVWRWGGRRGLRSTTSWHPHVGRTDLATYDLTLRWPAELTLLASGAPVDGGLDGEVRWTRNVLDVPTKAVSFEIDDYDVVREEIGHIELVVGFYEHDPEMTPERRAEIVTVLKAALLFYESRLGVLPIDRVTVVITDRGFSQGLLGFLTLTEWHMHRRPPALVDDRTGTELRMTLIAHEVAHQWWGHTIGWHSYRDQWLSEAMATFSATEFMTTIARDPEDHLRRSAERLGRLLGFESIGGTPTGSLGSVTLGRRLLPAHGAQAYHVVVYDKGAAVFATLAERLGRDPAWQMLGALAKAVANRTIRTETFLAAFERMSGQSLSAFADQYVYESGVPVVVVEYEPRQQADGSWTLDGVVRQLPAERFRYAVRHDERGWDVIRRHDREPDTSAWELQLPFVLDASTAGTPAGIAGTLTIRGERSEFSIPAPARPVRLAIDPGGRLLIEAHAGESGSPEIAYRLGEHLLRLGRLDEARAELARALAAAESRSDGEDALVVPIRLALARYHLDRNDTKEARGELNAVERLLPEGSDLLLGERVVLEARADTQAALFDRAGVRLGEFLQDVAGEIDVVHPDALIDPSRVSHLRFSRGEALALQALVEQKRRYVDAEVLIRIADRAGVDVRALEAP